MRLIKLAVISFIVLGLLVTALTSLLPSTVYVTRTINIQAPKDSVFAQINDLRNWKNWYANMDSATLAYGHITTGPSAFVRADKTSILINSVTDSKIIVTWQTASNRPLEGSFTFRKDSADSETSIQWEFVIPVKWYPWEKLSSIVSDKALGGVMEKSLDKLKLTQERRL